MRNIGHSYMLAAIFACLVHTGAAGSETIVTRTGEPGVKAAISIEPGSGWLHTMRIAGILPLKNSPQIAVWAEDGGGNYLETLYVTHRTAVQDWRTSNEKVRRPESLPFWAHRRGVKESDGLYLPTKKHPLPDAVTAPTPRGAFTLSTVLPRSVGPVTVYVEVNHSFDHNDRFPKSAKPGGPGWSGVSGQPAAVYSAIVDPAAKGRTVEFKLVGHSSPDGSNGSLAADVSPLTTAKTIISRITVMVE